VILAVLSLGSAAAAHPLEPVPAGHWAYESLYQLAAAGLISFQDLAQQPLMREEIAGLTEAAGRTASGRRLAPGLADVLEALKREFLPQTGGSQVIWGSRVWGAAADEQSLTAYPRTPHGPSMTIQGGVGGPRSLLWAEGAWGDGTASLTRGYAVTRIGSIYLETGREAQRWGGSARTTLLLDDHASTLDQIRLSFVLPRMRLSTFAALLSRDPNRYLVGSRADWMVTDQFRLGVSELAITRDSSLIGYWIFNPIPALVTNPGNLIPIEQELQAKSNILLTADFDLLAHPGVVLYGQVLADDLLVDPSPFPPRIGALAGLYVGDPFKTGRTSLRLEYSGVSNWTYTEMGTTQDHFISGGRSLGYWPGNDSDDLYLELSHVVSPEVAVSAWLSRSRHGEGRIGTVWTSGDAAWKDWWLSGVVESRYAVGARYERRDIGAATRYWVEVGYVVNRDNIAGADGADFRFGVELSWQW